MLLEITIPPQTKGIIEIEVETVITVSVINTCQKVESGHKTCRWNLSPRFLSCFNLVDDFKSISLWRLANGIFKLDVEFDDYESDSEGQKIPNTDYVSSESLEVSTVQEVQCFPSVIL